ncbi:MAG: hypothetical protein GY795_47810 [Desulfobacterales bacterium]|nr:hypothetical protein [Desulfobacterales bacterium]
MPYVTSIERIASKNGFEKGRIQEGREMVLQAVETRFQAVPEDMVSHVNSIETGETLKSLHYHAIVCENIDKFREILRKAH